jgi:hypothetical protein
MTPFRKDRLKSSIVRAWSAHKWLAALVVAAFLLRVIGVWGDWPFGFLHIDEGFHIRNVTELMQDKTVAPDNLVYPTGYPVALTIPVGITMVIGLAMGFFSSTGEIVARFLVEPGFIYTGARVWTALLGSLTVAVVFQIGKQAYGLRAGWFAAGLLTVSLLHVEISHLAIPEVQVGFLVTLGLLFCLRYARSPRFLELLIAGMLFGLAVSTKQSALPAVLPLAIAWIYGRLAVGDDRRWIWHAAAGTAAALLVFVVTSPVYITQYSTALNENIGSGGTNGFSMLSNGKIGLFDGPDYVWTFQMWLSKDWALAAVAIGGLGLAAFRRSAPDIVLGSFAVGFFVVSAAFAVHQVHYIVPAIPVMFAFAGRVTDWSLVRAKEFGNRWYLTAIAMLFVVMALTGAKSAGLVIGLTGTDTRMQARDWVLNNVVEGSSIAITNPVYGPPLQDLGSERYLGESALGNSTVRGFVTEYLDDAQTYVLTPHLADSDGVLIPVEYWAEIGWEYVVVSSFDTDQFLVNEPPPRDNFLRTEYDVGRAYYLALPGSSHIGEVVRFTPSLRHPGPTLVIYRVLATPVQPG